MKKTHEKANGPFRQKALAASFLAAALFLCVPAAAVDTFSENFDGLPEGTTINGVRLWSVTQGPPSMAMAALPAPGFGGGTALAVMGDPQSVVVRRPSAYGDVSPCWVEFVIKPGVGAEPAAVPTDGIAALTFDFSGKIMASSGQAWADTGMTYSIDQWYRVTLKIDFDAHRYDVYVTPASVPKVPFVPDAQNLAFINPSISSLSEVGFSGAYSASGTGHDTYLDNLLINFVDRLQIITAPQTIKKNAGSAPMTVQLQNSNGEAQTAWQDIQLDLLSDSPTGQFSAQKEPWLPITQVTVSEGAQTATFYYKDTRPGNFAVSVTAAGTAWQNAAQEIKVVEETPAFEVSAASPQVAGQPFTVEITAKDEGGNTNEGFTGQVSIHARYISPETGSMQLLPAATSAFVAGVAQVTMTYPDAGAIAIDVADVSDDSKTGSSGNVIFTPASFGVSLDAVQTVGKTFPLTVTALNSAGAVTPNYQGPAVLHLEGVLPLVAGTLTPGVAEGFSSGTAQMPTVYNLWGRLKVEARDSSYPQKNGFSGPVMFQPVSLKLEVAPPPSGRDFFYTGESFKVTVSALDFAGEPIPNFGDKISISGGGPLGMPSEYQFTEADTGKKVFTVSAPSAGEITLSMALSDGTLPVQSPVIKIHQATIVILDSSAPIGSTQVEIHLVDENGQIITSENDLTITVVVDEENPDGSLSFYQSPLRFWKGRAWASISDSEAETVTVSATSKFDMKVKKGTVVFGRFAKTGVGTLMWRELKDE